MDIDTNSSCCKFKGSNERARSHKDVNLSRLAQLTPFPDLPIERYTATNWATTEGTNDFLTYDDNDNDELNDQFILTSTTSYGTAGSPQTPQALDVEVEPFSNSNDAVALSPEDQYSSHGQISAINFEIQAPPPNKTTDSQHNRMLIQSIHTESRFSAARSREDVLELYERLRMRSGPSSGIGNATNEFQAFFEGVADLKLV